MPAASTLPASVVARLTTDRAAAQAIGDALAESFDAAEVAAASVEEADGRWSLAVHFRERPNETAVRALVALAAGAAAANALTFEPLAAQDWVRTSLDGLTPVAAGRFVVHGAHDRDRVPINRIAVEIAAALAFGTGHHGTTRGCLLALDRLVKLQRGRRGKVLDVGTGSGVLAIAAAKALRRPVLASDIDARAVTIARHNARLNRVGGFGRGRACGRPRRRALARPCAVRARLRQYPARSAAPARDPDGAPGRSRREGGALRPARAAGEHRACRLSCPRPRAGAAHPARRLGDAGAAAARGGCPLSKEAVGWVELARPNTLRPQLAIVGSRKRSTQPTTDH